MALKLSDADKKTIVELYQQPEESTATLASRYAVSSSTISRILKQELSPAEYKSIVQQKKGGGSKPQSPKVSSSKSKKASEKGSDKPKPKSSQTPSPSKPTLKSTVVADEEVTEGVDVEEKASEQKKPARKKTVKRGRTRQRSSTKAKAIEEDQETATSAPEIVAEQLTLADSVGAEQKGDELDADETVSPSSSESEEELAVTTAEITVAPEELVHEIQSDLLDSKDFDDEDTLDDEDLDDEDLDDEDLNEDDDIDAALELPLDGDSLAILPFSEAKLPRTCYIIIDRSAELITRPLKTFADLGTVPDEEINEPTLPIFDNHRVAKRFANRRTQRIVKVPDARVLRKTSTYLMDKGITRLLLDGQVYALLDEEDMEPLE